MTDNWKVEQGDCRDIMRTLPDNSVDAIVSDPPYGLSFMGKAWDHGVPGVEFWTEALRVAKPGAHLVAFGGTRTYHRLAVAIEDAGWEVRDCLSWLYGSGFPKSLDVSKAMDKSVGAERETLGPSTSRGLAMKPGRSTFVGEFRGERPSAPPVTAPATDLAREWQGWGTALKPAWEPIILARKPLTGTVAANVTQYGTGAINVDGCRIATTDNLGGGRLAGPTDMSSTCGGTEWDRPWMHDRAKRIEYAAKTADKVAKAEAMGRWPANVCLDEDAAAMLDAQSGERKPATSRSGAGWRSEYVGGEKKNEVETTLYGDTGGASRFFYTAKVSRREREAGLDGMPNAHPTLKPIALMRWLCRLVTPPDGLILDPFNGSGSTGCAAVLEGFRYLGCELEAEYVEIARRRIAYWESQRAEPDLFG